MNSSKEISIVKQFKTETAHIVREAFSSRCRHSVHGHKYVWEVALNGEISEKDGMLLDFKKLQGIKQFIDKFDHATVLWSKESNEVLRFFKNNFRRVLVMNKNCTAEGMARLTHNFVNEWAKSINKKIEVDYVRVWETETGSAIAKQSDSEDRLVYTFIDEDDVDESFVYNPTPPPVTPIYEAKHLPIFDEVLN